MSTNPSVTIQTHEVRPDAADSLLARVRWGSGGALQYQVRSPTAWNRLSSESRFYTATDPQGALLGFYALSEQSWGYLRLLLAVDPTVLGTGIGRRLVEEVVGLDLPLAGTIEADNAPSLQLSLSAGYRQVATFETQSFTRTRPRTHAQMRRPTPDELPTIAARLAAQDHDWFDPEQLLADEIWVTDDLSAGIQLCCHRWTLHHLGLPVVDGLVRALLPRLGVHPADFRFATGHHWWGDPQRWDAILEHAMAAQSLQSIVLTGDRTSPLWTGLLEAISPGVVGTAMGRNTMVVTSNTDFHRPLMFTPLNAV